MFRHTQICDSHNVTQNDKVFVIYLGKSEGAKKLIATPETQRSSSILVVYFSCKMTVRGDLKVSLLEMDVNSRRVKLNFLAFQHDQIWNEKFSHCSHMHIIDFFKYKPKNAHVYMQNIKPHTVSQPVSFIIQILYL